MPARGILAVGFLACLAGCSGEQPSNVTNDESMEASAAETTRGSFEMNYFQIACENIAEVLMAPDQTTTCVTLRPGDVVTASRSDAQNPMLIDGAYYLKVASQDGLERWMGVGTEEGQTLSDWATPVD